MKNHRNEDTKFSFSEKRAKYVQSLIELNKELQGRLEEVTKINQLNELQFKEVGKQIKELKETAESISKTVRVGGKDYKIPNV